MHAVHFHLSLLHSLNPFTLVLVPKIWLYTFVDRKNQLCIVLTLSITLTCILDFLSNKTQRSSLPPTSRAQRVYWVHLRFLRITVRTCWFFSWSQRKIQSLVKNETCWSVWSPIGSSVSTSLSYHMVKWWTVFWRGNMCVHIQIWYWCLGLWPHYKKWERHINFIIVLWFITIKLSLCTLSYLPHRSEPFPNC